MENPDPAQRAEYRRALAALPRDKIPAGLRVTFTGRDSGNLVISLTDVPAPPDPEPMIPIPEHLDPSNPLLRHLVEHPELLRVAPASWDRALRVLQAIFDECNRRGHLAQPSTESTLELVIMGEVLTARLSEESQKAHRPPDEEIAGAKYDWQRIPARETCEFNGRLVLTLEPQKWRPSSWADSKRWSLESRLPKFLKEAEEVARARAAEREKRQRERREKRLRWEQSRPLAVTAYLDQLNRERLDAQLNAYNQSRRLADYATALEHAVAETTGTDRAQVVAWIAWIREEAVRLDPINHPDQLTYVTPEHLPVTELSRFMPKGLDYSYPPDPGDD